jgi:hypothetical protein
MEATVILHRWLLAPQVQESQEAMQEVATSESSQASNRKKAPVEVRSGFFSQPFSSIGDLKCMEIVP